MEAVVPFPTRSSLMTVSAATFTLALALAPASIAVAQDAPATGISVVVSDWLPHWDEDGGWAVALSGGTPGKWAVQSSDDAAAVLPGRYDFYWIQDADHADAPMLMVEGVEVVAGALTEVAINTGILLEVADWVEPRDPELGYWGAVPADAADAEALVNWTTGAAMVLPPGVYDTYWEPHSSDGRNPTWLGQVTIEVPFTGVGLEVQLVDEVVAVVRTLPGGPAERAGILAGDQILTAGDIDLAGLTLGEAVDHLRGPAGASIDVGVRRGGELLTITVERDRVETQAIERLDSGVRLVVDPAVPPLEPDEGGYWAVTYAGEGFDNIAIWSDRADQIMLIGNTGYDVYWLQNRDSEPRLLAEGVRANGTVVDIPVVSEDPPPRPLKP